MDKKVKKEKRFAIVHSENIGLGMLTNIILDKETGVHYLFHQYGSGAGLTPLLDKDGKPVIAK